jgi:hypothetical protein
VARPAATGDEHVVIPDLHIAAERETADLSIATRMTAGGTDSLDGRPVVARIRSRRRRQRIWAMRLFFADESAQVRWSTMVGITADASPPGVDVREALDAVVVTASAKAELSALAATLIESAGRFASTAVARDDEILVALEANRARLVPRERSLFDRRDERASMAQLEVLADAVAQCERRRHHYTSLQQLTLACCDLAFAVSLE